MDAITPDPAIRPVVQDIVNRLRGRSLTDAEADLVFDYLRLSARGEWVRFRGAKVHDEPAGVGHDVIEVQSPTDVRLACLYYAVEATRAGGASPGDALAAAQVFHGWVSSGYPNSPNAPEEDVDATRFLD